MPTEFALTWNQSFKNYAADLSRIYIKQPESIINCLGFSSVSGCLNECYLSLVKEKELVPIEILPESEKLRLWIKAKQIGQGKKQCIEVSRSLYLLEQLTK